MSSDFHLSVSKAVEALHISSPCCKILAKEAEYGANGSNRAVLISPVSQAQPTQTVIFLPHFPHPSNLSQPSLPQLDDEKQWIYIQRAAILFSLLHRVLCFPLSPLLPCHWRLVNGLKRHSIGRCTPSRRGGLTFPGVGKRNSYRPQTSCPLNEHLIQFPDACNTKNRSGGLDMCWLGCRVGLGEEGLVGREVLMDFRLVSQFLFTQERWGGGGGDKEEKQTPNIWTCAHIHRRQTGKKGCLNWPLDLLIIYSLVDVFIMQSC